MSVAVSMRQSENKKMSLNKAIVLIIVGVKRDFCHKHQLLVVLTPNNRKGAFSFFGTGL